MWQVKFTKKAYKQLIKLDLQLQDTVAYLVREIEENGPMRADWKNFSKLSKTQYHCHIKKGRPTFVVCWEVLDKKIKIIEVYYVGTHEKAPY